jgi:DNA polymerase-3 subunit beta
MIFTVDKQEFKEGVHNASRFSQKSAGSLPALSGVALIATDSTIALRATNLETGVDIRVTGEVKASGIAVVPAAVLREITASQIGTGLLTIEHLGDILTLTSSAGKSTIKTLPADDFPSVPVPEGKVATISIPGAIISNLISTVVSCASPSTVRPELGSVLITSKGSELVSVATDSFRLAEKRVALSENLPEFSILIPAKNAVEIVQTIPDTEIEIRVDEHQCAFSWAQGVLSTRLVTLPYPDYAQIIPKSFIAEATLLKKDLDASLKRSSIFSDSFQKIKLTIQPSESVVRLSAKNNDVGESVETIPSAVTGEMVELSFNHRYVSAPLSMVSGENIMLQASGIGRPMLIRGQGDSSFLYLVMPMNQ